MLPVYSILRNSELSYIEILKFVQNLPFCFICSQSYPRNIFQRNFSILCSKCKIKTIDIQILKDLKKGKISISYICKHLQKTIIETETNLTRFLHFNLEMDENQIFYIKSRFSVKHPLRMIGKVIVDSTCCAKSSEFEYFTPLFDIIAINFFEYTFKYFNKTFKL